MATMFRYHGDATGLFMRRYLHLLGKVSGLQTDGYIWHVQGLFED